MMSAALRNRFLGESDDITKSWKWSGGKQFMTSWYDVGWRQTLYQNCIARPDLKLCFWQVFILDCIDISKYPFKYYEIVCKTYISYIISWNCTGWANDQIKVLNF
jgi:hypothetical protein